MDIHELSANLNSIVSGFDKIVDDFIKKYDPDLIDLNQEQMLEGQNADGGSIGDLRDPEYIKFKRSMGSKAAFSGLADLKLTGQFQSSMYVEHKGDNIYIDSRDDKKNKLTKKYGYQIFGVQKEKLDQLISGQIEPDFISLMENKMGI